MSRRVSPTDARALATAGSRVSIRRGLAACGCLLTWGFALAACTSDQLQQVPQSVSVVQGEPTVGQSSGTVENLGPVNPGSYTQTNPFQVDDFTQQAVAKTDILFMIDNSGSMAPKQAKLQADFGDFMTALTSGLVSIDYHIGVITTDTYNPTQSGKLQNPGGLSSPWIGPDTCPAGSCNPVTQFNIMSDVGTGGSGDEKGILAASMALTSPLTDAGGANAGFLRPDASLTVIFISDEEDGSCGPLAYCQEGCNTSPAADCTTDPSAPYCTPCYDLSNAWCDTDLPWGNAGYWSREFKEIKGSGNEGLVNMSVFVGNSMSVMVPEGVGTEQFEGCLVQGADPTNPFSYAIYSPRWMTIATNVSGASAVHSICDEDFSAAEQQIAIRAALQTTFYLSRNPLGTAGCVSPYSGSCQITVTVNGTAEAPGDSTWNYTGAAQNAVIFTGMVPPAGATIVISYPVNE